MRFLADMGISPRIVDWLRSNGHDAVHLRDQGLHRLPNGDIFAKAADEARVVLTFDLDFGEIVAMSPRLVSVVVFRLRDTRTHRVIARLQEVLAQSSDALATGAVIAVEDDSQFAQAMKALTTLRSGGFSADIVATGSPRKRFDRAVKKGASEILILSSADGSVATRIKTVGEARAEAALAGIAWPRLAAA